MTPSASSPRVGDLDPGAAIRRRLFEYEPASLYPTPRAAKWGRWGNWIVLPSVALYCIFFVNFGEHEHVFSTPRRWLDRQKRAFWSLSPAEESLAQTQTSGENNADGASKPSTTPPASS
ncbi:hypothetical protein EXIGLDRAFT_719969 [Exidia glandulosa HHB12029]|uniref:Uncharacterized protein n=1 Tax=Exidia glandulosa HHB12029 TaxID=1314781 RepID=A0A165NKZ3_EXIGL|nr:hypothetical protein EXIGLDRAFT_719969 [Exidia glandulosa HHB12029]